MAVIKTVNFNLVLHALSPSQVNALWTWMWQNSGTITRIASKAWTHADFLSLCTQRTQSSLLSIGLSTSVSTFLQISSFPNQPRGNTFRPPTKSQLSLTTMTVCKVWSLRPLCLSINKAFSQSKPHLLTTRKFQWGQQQCTLNPWFFRFLLSCQYKLRSKASIQLSSLKMKGSWLHTEPHQSVSWQSLQSLWFFSLWLRISTKWSALRPFRSSSSITSWPWL